MGFLCHVWKNLTEGIYRSKIRRREYNISPVFTLAIGILFTLFQSTSTGTIIGVVKTPTTRVVLLTPKYTELWNKQNQQRLDNYWELFKPDFAAHKEHFTDFIRISNLESFGYVISAMRRELGVGASQFIKDASATGQFEFRGIPLGTYLILVQTTVNSQDAVWTRTVELQTDIPVFVDLSKPTS